MEAIIVVVGYLGAGKTTFLKKLVKEYMSQDWSPNVILNDYKNAMIDAQQFFDFLPKDKVDALSGSCICCSGLSDLRRFINNIPEREKGITFVEANGTTDSCALMEYMGVGIEGNFLPPVQVSMVDVRNWQKRGCYNDLEENQVQVSSMVVLSHLDGVSEERVSEVRAHIEKINPTAKIQTWDEVDLNVLPELKPSENEATKLDHQKAHWSSCSIDLPDPINSNHLKRFMDSLPESLIRVKGCTKLNEDEHYTYFERIPDGRITIRPYTGDLATGPKLVTVGPGSDPQAIDSILQNSAML